MYEPEGTSCFDIRKEFINISVKRMGRPERIFSANFQCVDGNIIRFSAWHEIYTTDS